LKETQRSRARARLRYVRGRFVRWVLHWQKKGNRKERKWKS
jgi:hypothetical protein